MNEFLGVGTGGSILKNFYQPQQPMSYLQTALKKRRRRKMQQYGMEPNDMGMIENSNMGYAKMRGFL